MLDTKNFVQQTGARTFEAAAFLRRAGADIERVKELFIETFDSIQLRAKWYLKPIVPKVLLFLWHQQV